MKPLKALFWLVLLAASASAQVRGLVVREVDGSPRGTGITEIVVSNTTLTISGTATATAIDYEGVLRDGTTISAATRATALDTTVCAVTAVTAATCRIRGVIVVNAAGTLTVQFAQNASDGGASTVLVNQAFSLRPIS